MNLNDAKVLIVDDDLTNLQVLGNILRHEQYKVSVASGAKETFDVLSADVPDIILLDIMMPEIDGFEVCRRLKSDDRYRHIPVIFISALDQNEYTVNGFKVGAADYISKPFDTEIVLARLTAHLKIKMQAQELTEINNTLENKVDERTEELREANEKLTNLDNMKSEFLQIISHEIRTPLNGILGVSQLIQDRLGESEISGLINVLNDSVNRLESFALDAIMFSHLRLKKYRLSLKTVDITETVNDVENRLSERISEKQVVLNLEYSRDAILLTVDNRLLRKALYEILKNALQYTDPNTEITVSSELIDANFVISVKDEGKGFSEKSFTHLYTLFSPGETHIDRNDGINLAMCKLIMEAHKGDIHIENSPKGAIVKLIFPNP